MKWVILTFPDKHSLAAFEQAFACVAGATYPQEYTFSGILADEQLEAACSHFAATLHSYVPAAV